MALRLKTPNQPVLAVVRLAPVIADAADPGSVRDVVALLAPDLAQGADLVTAIEHAAR